MATTEKKKIIPAQKKGVTSGAEMTLFFKDHSEVISSYEIFKKRFLNINEWEKYTGKLKTTFTLTGLNGVTIDDKEAKEGYLVKIDMPGPGPSGGRGYDWVKIELIEDTYDPLKDEALLSIRVRATEAPGSEYKAESHFFTDDSTNTFTLKRSGLSITGAVSGRNDFYNLHTSSILGKIRNLIIGILSSLGGSHMLWKNFLQNILEKPGQKFS